MLDRIKGLWDSLDTETVVNKRELFLELAVCVLAGILLGIMISPRKHSMIGCYNGDCTVEEAGQDEID